MPDKPNDAPATAPPCASDAPDHTPAPVEKPGETQVGTPARRIPIRVTKRLKAAAGRVNLEGFDEPDQMLMDGGYVTLKYDSQTEAQIVTQKLQRLAAHLAIRDGRDAWITGTTIPADDTDRCEFVPVPFHLLQPGVFDELIADVAKTELEIIEADEHVVVALKQFAESFQLSHLVRLDLVTAHENADREGCERCERWLTQAHESLVEFAGFVAAAECGDARIVVIAGTSLSTLQITCDGKVIDFKKHNAAKRALLTLARLREKERFSLEEFEAQYTDATKAKSKPGKTFENAMTELKKFFPAVRSDKHADGRSVSGLVFKSVPTDDQMKACIESMPPRQNSKNA